MYMDSRDFFDVYVKKAIIPHFVTEAAIWSMKRNFITVR